MTANVVFVGWSHHGAPLDLRERLVFTPERSREALEGLFRERILSEGAIVSTCNRAEVYGLSDREDGAAAVACFLSDFQAIDAAVLRDTAFSGRGEPAVRHLFRVASGLDSMVLGEAQILGQIREAHRRASEARTARAVTNRLFQSALECGKRVRSETALGQRPTSVAGVALSLTGRIFESLAGRRVLLVGAGETIELTASLLVEQGVAAADVLFTNRSADKAEALAARSGGCAIPWEERFRALAEVDVALSATAATEPVMRAADVAKALRRVRRRGPLLVLDLAVPRDFDTGVDDLPDVYRYDLDALQGIAARNTAERRSEVPRAEAIVDESVTAFLAWLASLSHVDVVRGLREKLESARREELGRYAGKLQRLSPEDQKVVERLTETLVAKILHEPTIGLKEGDASDRLARAAAVRALFRLEGGE